MRRIVRRVALAAVVLAGYLAGTVQAGVILYDGSLAQDVTVNAGGSTWNYNPDSAYAFAGYNTANVTYTEGVTGILGGTDKELKVVSNGGVDGILRYSFSPSRVQAFAADRTAGNEPFLFDIDANPTLTFDILYAGDASFGRVLVDINSNTVGAPGVTLLDQGLTANTITSVSISLGAGSDFQNWVSLMGGAGTLGNTAQLRIEVQTGSTDSAGTFYIDNIQIVPEPASLGLLGLGTFGVLFLRRRRMFV